MRNDAMSLSPMDIVKQTGTTIIFEEFNAGSSDDPKKSLYTILTDGRKWSIEEFVKKLDSELVVKSFSEFEEKYSPVIYESYAKDGEGNIKFVYELDKPNGAPFTKINLKDHAFYKMMKDILDSKAYSDKGNLEFNYDEFTKLLTPSAAMEECKEIRTRLMLNTKEYYRLRADPKANVVEIKRLENSIMGIRKKILNSYYNQSPLCLLPLMIDYKQKMADSLRKGQNGESKNSSDGKSRALTWVYPVFEETGLDFKVQDPAKQNVGGECIEDNNQKHREIVANALQNDYKKNAKNKNEKEINWVATMVANAYTGDSGKPGEQNLEMIEEEIKKLHKWYDDSRKSFMKAVVGVVQRFMGVKSFFDHASYKGKLARNTKVIIANCKFNKLLKGDVRARFSHYFGALSNEKDVNRIWFGIIPSVRFDDCGASEGNNNDENNDEDVFARDAEVEDNEITKDDNISQIDSLKIMLSLLKEVKIMTFTNEEAGENNGFVGLNKEKIEFYKEKLERVDSEYAVFCYPNFTILNEGTRSDKISLSGVYLDSSYVACGMVVGIQNYEFLKSKGFYVNEGFPCVRFSLEDEDHSKIVTTKLNRETTAEMLKETKDAMQSFGFAFADNRIIYKDKILNNSYVISERSLKKRDASSYKPICWTLVKNTVDQILRSIDDKISMDTFNKFKSEFLDSWKRDNKDDCKKFDNRILLDGESIDPDTKGKEQKLKLKITYKGDEDTYEEIVFTEQTEDNNGGK